MDKLTTRIEKALTDVKASLKLLDDTQCIEGEVGYLILVGKKMALEAVLAEIKEATNG
jgi:hypothetical protein